MKEDLKKIEYDLYRVCNLLERGNGFLKQIVELLQDGKEKKKKPTGVANALSTSQEQQVGKLLHKIIGIYVEAIQKRYGRNCRPDVGAKARGILTRLLKDHGPERLAIIIQAYVQMEDAWFDTKCHDIATLEQNVGKVQIALANGTARAQDASYWSKVFEGGDDGRRSVQEANRQVAGDVSRKKLSSGENETFSESIEPL